MINGNEKDPIDLTEIDLCRDIGHKYTRYKMSQRNGGCMHQETRKQHLKLNLLKS